MLRRAALLVLAGCSKIIGIGDVSLGGDAPPGDGGPDAPPNTVIGTSFTRCITASGTFDQPLDQSGVAVQALIPDANEATGYRVVDGTGGADGSIRIDNVPDGQEYILKINKSYFVTKAHSIKHFFLVPQRCSPAPTNATTSTKLNFALTGMQAFENAPDGVFDSIEVDSFNLLYQGLPTAANGDTSFTRTFDWASEGNSIFSGQAPLLDASAMDDLYVLHLRREPQAGGAGRTHLVTHVIDSFTTSALTLADGATVAVNGAFAPATASKTFNVFMTRGNFDSLYDGTSQFSNANVAVLAHPVLNDFVSGAPLASVDMSDWSRSPNLNESLGVSYADPFPASWQRMLSVDYFRARLLLVPGTTIARPLFASYQHVVPFIGGVPNLSPSLTTPGNVKLAGFDAGLGGKIAFDGVKPVTVSWTAASGAKLYAVFVFRVFANGNQTKTAFTGSFFTTKSSVDLPAEVFSGSEFFAFTVQAVQTPSDFVGGELVPTGVPFQLSPYSSGMFRLSAKCGDGNVDAGEECDTSGESATCDVDCTARKCGDGLRNATAGEACDTINDTSGCDSDCTLPVCGDGHLNPVLEDCDDGNTTSDGNGCSADCHFNNVCGDGIVQALAEQCDGGGVDTATCDKDCTVPDCPDGHLNLAAGEQCDDGNFDDSDHCDSTCHIN